MNHTMVEIVSCNDYEMESVNEAVKKIVNCFHGVFDLIRPGMKVLIKANICTPTLPERAATTHPSLIVALTKEVLKRGAKVLVGDDPIAPNVANETLQLSGINKALSTITADSTVFSLENGFASVNVPDSYILKKVNFARSVLEADFIINVPKLKTHILTQMSCGVKNYMGCVERNQRKEIHSLHGNDEFAAALLDIYKIRPADLTVVDAIVGMSGLGPSNGIPTKIGYLIASENVYATDYVAASILGYNPLKVTTVKLSRNYGLFDENGIIYDENTIDDCRKSNLQLAPYISDTVRKRFSKQLSLYLVINKEHCIRCEECARQCPAHAIHIENMSIDFKKCKMCFCCFELCPQNAVEFTIPSILGNPYILSKNEMRKYIEKGEGV